MLVIVRNMECERCKTVVREELNKLGILYKYVELGEVELSDNVSNVKLEKFSDALKKSGFELIVNNKTLLTLQIKEVIKHLVYFSNDLARPNFSEYISKKVNYNYNYLSKVFSEMEGITLEKYFIKLRIRRVKELLLCEKPSINEIAYKLYFSSVAHLSNQFKKVTGLTPLQFRQLTEHRSKKLLMSG
jgi:YesN/AraC family two-component response regulator